MLQDVTFALVAKTNGYSGRHHALLPGIHPLLMEQLLRHPTKALHKSVGIGALQKEYRLNQGSRNPTSSNVGVSQNQGYLFGAPIKRIITYWGLYWGSPILGRPA